MKKVEQLERGKGTSPADRAGAVKKEHDAELEKLKKNTESQPESEEESRPAETEEETKEETPKETPKETSPGEEQLSETEEPKLSDRAQKRFRELTQENKTLRGEVQKRQQVNDTLQSLGYTPGQADKISPDIDLSEVSEITEDQYKTDIAKQARYVVQQEMSKRDQLSSFQTRRENFHTDIEAIEKEYAVLNPDSENYNRELDETIGDYYEVMAARNPNIRLKDIAKKFVEVSRKSAEAIKKQSVNKIAKQASQQAMSPSGEGGETMADVGKKIEAAETIEELEKLRNEVSGA